MESLNNSYQETVWDEDLKKEFGDAFDLDMNETDQFFKENTEEFDFDLEDPNGDSF